MTDMAVVVLSVVDELNGSNDKGPWTKYTLKDGNGQVVGSTFDGTLGQTAKGLLSQRVEVDTKPARDPKFPPTVTAVRPAVDAPSSNGDTSLSKEEWLLKDRAADKRACIAIAAAQVTALWGSLPEPEPVGVLDQIRERTLWLAHQYFENVQRQRAELPFDAPEGPTDVG